MIFCKFKVCKAGFEFVTWMKIPFQILNFIALFYCNNEYSSIAKIVENLFIVRIFCQLFDKCIYFLGTVEMNGNFMSFEILLNFMWNPLELLA